MSRPRCRNKDVESILRAAEKLGATVTRAGRGSGHYKVRGPKGIAVIGGTPSHVAFDRIRRDLRRAGITL